MHHVAFKVQNGFIRQRMKELNIASVSELARRAGISAGDIGDILNFKKSPKNRDGGWRKSVTAIADILFAEPEDLFTQAQLSITTKKNLIERLMPESRLRQLMDNSQNLLLDESGDFAMQLDAESAVAKVLNTLTPREGKVLKLRFGIGGEDEHTLKEIAKIMGRPLKGIRQVEGEALRKLRHPARSEQLQSLLNEDAMKELQDQQQKRNTYRLARETAVLDDDKITPELDERMLVHEFTLTRSAIGGQIYMFFRRGLPIKAMTTEQITHCIEQGFSFQNQFADEENLQLATKMVLTALKAELEERSENPRHDP